MKNILLLLCVIATITIKSQGFGTSAFCQANVFCEPDWCDQRRSVVMIMLPDANGFYQRVGTGFLVANSKKDNTPYVLTALHVIDVSNGKFTDTEKNNYDFGSVRFVFNYQSTNCSPTGVPSTNETMTGCTFVSYVGENYGAGEGDWILLKLNERIDPSYASYLSGFSASSSKPAEITMIHHPSGDIKKISKSEGKLDRKNYIHIVKNWSVGGGAEGGSSGSPYFNENKRVVGVQMFAEPNVCSDGNETSASRLDQAWDLISGSDRQLKPWLDPMNASIIGIGGEDPCRLAYFFENANDLHTSANVTTFGNPSVGSRSYDGVYTASGLISTGENVNILASTSVEFYGESIEIGPGFEAKKGSLFFAKAQPCLGGCGNNKATESLSMEFEIENNDLNMIDHISDSKENNLEIFEFQNEVYPNPFNESITIVVSEEYLNGDFLVYNVLGTLIFSGKIDNQTMELNELDYLTKGLYSLILVKGVNSENHKILKN